MTVKNLYQLTHFSSKFVYFTLADSEEVARNRLREQLDRPVTPKATEGRKITLQKLKDANVIKPGKHQYRMDEWNIKIVKENAVPADFVNALNQASEDVDCDPHLVNNPRVNPKIFGRV